MRLFAKDTAIGEEFEKEAIARYFVELLQKPLMVRFGWERLDMFAQGDMVWIVAEGNALFNQDSQHGGS